MSFLTQLPGLSDEAVLAIWFLFFLIDLLIILVLLLFHIPRFIGAVLRCSPMPPARR